MNGNGVRVAEYFAGIGLARLGLEAAGMSVVWSNDISEKKSAMYRRQFPDQPGHNLVVGDLGSLAADQAAPPVDLAWASFPCTDLSLAGTRAGLHKGIASSTFWHFIKSLSRLGKDRPPVVALENVTAFATSHSGRDIASAISSLNGLGYSVDVLSMDARRFVPQSRPRLFLVGALNPPPDTDDANDLRPPWLQSVLADPSLRIHRAKLPNPPQHLESGLSQHVEQLERSDPRWWDANQVGAFVDSLSDIQRSRFDRLVAGETTSHRTAYRRMRSGVARWELRSDELAGCLRTPSGGSSRQAIVVAGRKEFSVRWMTPLEYASLMGAREYPLDGVSVNDAYFGFGDAVCVPAVTWLANNYLNGLIAMRGAEEQAISAAG